MKVASKFTIAVHIMLFILKFDGQMKTSSDNIAASVGVNPVIIRGILSDLKNADLIIVKFGTGGASLKKNAEEISLLDIYKAVIKEDDLFSFHQNPNPKCPVGKSIHLVLDEKLNNAKEAFYNSLANTKLSSLVNNIK